MTGNAGVGVVGGGGGGAVVVAAVGVVNVDVFLLLPFCC